ncbi:aminomethyltransferase family protein [Paenibacillus sp. 481]|uniref:aminomethyltransferase family protein n=1 Tax=Paenibacillus sp. 481 TaxID=2835869 RepID=UPI001E397D56|nr:aminomethyltransferase family protein [Paenibacillus sp. 481]UHA75641.1 aminomethyltransferase family protein [Paenibacillus sp. 481]
MDKLLNISALTEKFASGGTLRDDGGYGVVASYGDIRAEYNTIRTGIGIVNLSGSGLFKISGEGAVDFVSELVTRDIEFLDTEHVVFTLMLDDKGDILDLVSLYRLEDSFLIETSAMKRDTITAWLRERCGGADNVELEDLGSTHSLIGFEGPHAWKLAQTLITFEISSLPYQSFVETDIQGVQMLFIRSGFTGEYGYKVVAPHEMACSLWEQLMEFSGDEDDEQSEDERYVVAPVGAEALEIAMLEVRQPNAKVDGSISVYEACVEWFVSFPKEHYIGRDALMGPLQQSVNQRLVGFTAKAENEAEVEASAEVVLSLEVGNSVIIEDIKIGSIVQVVYSPILDKYLGLALVDQTFAVSGIQIEALDRTGERIRLTTQSSPYVIPKSWSIKMI